MSVLAVSTIKAASVGGISVALFDFFGDTETIFLLVIGLFSSLTSYFYDWIHQHPRVFGMKETSEIIKYSFYGLSMMFIVYFFGVNNGDKYIDLPPSVWGFIAALCSGSAIKIVEFGGLLAAKFATQKVK